jgi:hypothetical protein
MKARVLVIALVFLLIALPLRLSFAGLVWDFAKEAELDDWEVIRGGWEIDEQNGVLVGESIEDEGFLMISSDIWQEEWVDYTIEIRVRSIAPGNRHFGLGFRDDGKGNNHYGFYLDDDPGCCEGTYWFGFYNGDYNAISAFWGQPGNYDEAEDWNVLKIVVEDFTFDLYINGEHIETYQDSGKTYSKGPVGLVNDCNDGQTAIVEFDYIKIEGDGMPSAVLSAGKLSTTWGSIRSMP